MVRLFFVIALPISALLIASFYCVTEFHRYVRNSDHFALKTIELLNSGPLEKEYLRKVMGVSYNSNIFSFDIGELKQKLEADSDIHSASVSRFLPNILQIQYEAEKAVAILNAKNLYYVNKEGRAYRRLRDNDSLQFPILMTEVGKTKQDVPENLINAALSVIRLSKASKHIRRSNIGDIFLRQSKNGAAIELTMRNINRMTREQKLKSYYLLTFGVENISEQFQRAERVLQLLEKKKKIPTHVRLELGKKIVVKIAQKTYDFR